MKPQDTFDDLTWRLREISWQVKAIGFLVSQVSKDSMPNDEVYVGLGCLLEHLGSRISRVRKKIDLHFPKLEKQESIVNSQATQIATFQI